MRFRPMITCLTLAAVVAGCSHAAYSSAPIGAGTFSAQLSRTTVTDLARIQPNRDPVQLPPLPAGDVVSVNLVFLDRTIEIAPGVRYHAWTFNGVVPGPVIHARVGDTINVSLTNRASIGHSIDFHAALVPPDVAFQTVQPGRTLRFSWVAKYPGVFMYHCGTPPVLAHISNGMYGAVVVDPPGGWLPAARSYVLVQSEFYPSQVPGTADQFVGDFTKMKSGMPDFVVFNGSAFRYQNRPLPVTVGERVRLFFVNAGPSHFPAFTSSGRSYAMCTWTAIQPTICAAFKRKTSRRAPARS